jgi:hypothetical protein
MHTLFKIYVWITHFLNVRAQINSFIQRLIQVTDKNYANLFPSTTFDSSQISEEKLVTAKTISFNVTLAGGGFLYPSRARQLICYSSHMSNKHTAFCLGLASELRARACMHVRTY